MQKSWTLFVAYTNRGIYYQNIDREMVRLYLILGVLKANAIINCSHYEILTRCDKGIGYDKTTGLCKKLTSSF